MTADALDGSVLVDSSEFTWNQLVNGYELSGRDVAWLNLDLTEVFWSRHPKELHHSSTDRLVLVHIETDTLFRH